MARNAAIDIPTTLLSPTETMKLAKAKVETAREFVSAVLEATACQDYLLGIWGSRKSAATMSENFGHANEPAEERSANINRCLTRASNSTNTLYRRDCFLDARLSFDLYVDAADKAPLSQPARELLQVHYAKYLAPRNLLVAHNMLLVPSFIAHLRNQGVPYDDLIQEGCLGLIRAIDKYDPTHGTKISTYARWWILRIATDALKDGPRTIRVPRHIHVQMQRVNAWKSQFIAQYRRDPTPEEIWAQFPNIPPTKQDVFYWASQAVTSIQAVEPARVEAFAGSDAYNGLDYEETTETEEGEPVDPEAETYTEIQGMLAAMEMILTGEERAALEMKFGIKEPERTTWEIGRVLGVNKARAKAIIEEATLKMREYMETGLE